MAERLLAEALGSGGDYADLYFEYRSGADFVFEEGRVRTVGRASCWASACACCGATPPATPTPRSCPRSACARPPAPPGRSPRAAAAPGPVPIRPVALPDFYPVADPSLERARPRTRSRCSRADQAARAFDPRIVRVEASMSEEWREVLVVTSDGRYARDRQPMIRFGVHAVAEEGGKRQGGRSGGAARRGMEYFAAARARARRSTGARRPAWRSPCCTPPRRRPGPMPVVLGPGESGILLHEAVGHGLEADFNRKKTSNYTDQLGQPVACDAVHGGRRRHPRQRARLDQRRRRGQPRAAQRADRERHPGRLHAGPHLGPALRHRAHRQRPARELPARAAAAHDQHLHAGRAGRPRGHHPSRSSAASTPSSFSGGQVNISNGDFVFSLTESYLIEDGKLTAPLKGVNLIGNGPEVLRKVTMVGSDFQLSDGIWTCGKDGQSVPVGIGTPTVKISEITVGGTRTS